MRTRIYSYNPYSASAKALAEALGAKRIKHHNSKYKPKPDDVIINWGCSDIPPHLVNVFTLNDGDYIERVSNKLSFFHCMLQGGCEDIVVPFADGLHRKAQVAVWLAEGKTVVARTKLTGHSGEGVVLLEGVGAEIVEAPLYTLYIPKKEEYRVHVYRRKDGAAEVFDIQRKAKRNDVPKEEANYRIRNLAGGFIYARQELNVPECVEDVALKVFEQTGLDFGAVDIIYQESKNKAFALEVNTAPGLAGTTLEKYVEMFNELL